MELRCLASPLRRRSLCELTIFDFRFPTGATPHFQTYHPTRSWLVLAQRIVPTRLYERSRDAVRDLHSTLWRRDDTRQAGWRSSGESQWGRSPWRARSFPCAGRGASIPVVLHIHGTRRMGACWYKPHPHKNGCWVLCDTHHHPHIEPWLCALCCQSLSTHDTHTHPYLIARTSRWQ